MVVAPVPKPTGACLHAMRTLVKIPLVFEHQQLVVACKLLAVVIASCFHVSDRNLEQRGHQGRSATTTYCLIQGIYLCRQRWYKLDCWAGSQTHDCHACLAALMASFSRGIRYPCNQHVLLPGHVMTMRRRAQVRRLAMVSWPVDMVLKAACWHGCRQLALAPGHASQPQYGSPPKAAKAEKSLLVVQCIMLLSLSVWLVWTTT